MMMRKVKVMMILDALRERMGPEWTLTWFEHGYSEVGLQIAQSRYNLQTLDPKVGTICILGALGDWSPTGRYHGSSMDALREAF